MALEFVHWGLIDYQEALDKQLALLQEVADGRSDTIVFCSHPSIVTLGRVTEEGDVSADWIGPTLSVQRGGRATYHGPSQLVIYPILNLQKPREKRPPKDVLGFLRDLEQAIVSMLSDLGLQASGKVNDATGVWVQDKKVASLGVAVKRWVTYHGAALNVEFDSAAFQGMKPCGMSPKVMTSIEELLGATPDRSFIEMRLRSRLLEYLS